MRICMEKGVSTDSERRLSKAVSSSSGLICLGDLEMSPGISPNPNFRTQPYLRMH